MQLNFETFMLGLLIVSTLTGLTTEAIKKVMDERKLSYRPNTIAGFVAVILSAVIGICYVLLNSLTFTTSITIYLVALMFVSWLSSMVGYDKVVQTISQFKTSGKADE